MAAPKLIATRIPPPVLAILAALLMTWIAWQTPAVITNQGLRWAMVAVFVALGAIIELAAIYTFWRVRTTINPLNPKATSSLVTAGVYRVTRNPMYVGLSLQLLAYACYLASPAALIGIPVFMMAVTWLQIMPEEAVLQAHFGDDYRAYQAQVRRWL